MRTTDPAVYGASTSQNRRHGAPTIESLSRLPLAARARRAPRARAATRDKDPHPSVPHPTSHPTTTQQVPP
eukprot:scaffold37801_cov85-Cyclotella_meneghiniana.AAC.5